MSLSPYSYRLAVAPIIFESVPIDGSQAFNGMTARHKKHLKEKATILSNNIQTSRKQIFSK
jgi:hypothetical protein